MKKLRMFDSLKLVLATVACIFAFAPAHADNTWKYTPIPIRYYATDSLVELTESDENFNTYTVKTTTTTANRFLYVQTENSLPANHKYFLNFRFKSNFTHRPYFRCSFDGGTTYESFWYSYTCRSNTWCNLSTIKTPQQDWQFVNVSNGILPLENTYTAGETITFDKNGFLTVFDLTEIFGAGNEPATAADAERALSIDTTIKIATTKYNEQQFAPVETRLDAAVAAVDTVVSQTMTQAQQIDQIATNKQTRPDEGCTAKYCLLVEDEDGTPHWYPIAGANGVAHNLPAGYTEVQYIEFDGNQYMFLPTFSNAVNIDVSVDVEHTNGDNEQILFANNGAGIQLLYTSNNSWRVWKSGKSNKTIATSNDRHLITIKTTPTSCEYYVDNQKNTNVPEDFFNSTEFSGKRLSIGARRVENEVGYFWKGKIYSFKAECNGVMCINMVPARNSSGEIGMLDLADANLETAFHTNAGTGTFTAGPDM